MTAPWSCNRNLVPSQDSPHDGDESQECWKMLEARPTPISQRRVSFPRMLRFSSLAKGNQTANLQLHTEQLLRNTKTRSNEFFLLAWLTGLPFWLAGSFCPTTSPWMPSERPRNSRPHFCIEVWPVRRCFLSFASTAGRFS